MTAEIAFQHSGEFTRVDSAKDGNWFVTFMDMANSLTEVCTASL
jgi:hypothetical protein